MTLVFIGFMHGWASFLPHVAQLFSLMNRTCGNGMQNHPLRFTELISVRQTQCKQWFSSTHSSFISVENHCCRVLGLFFRSQTEFFWNDRKNSVNSVI